MQKLIAGMPAEWSQYTRVIGPAPARTVSPKSAAKRYMENEVCCCASCIAVMPWRAEVKKRRMKRVGVDSRFG